MAVSLREYGYEAPITLVGAEPHLPYQRPPLSKAFLVSGDASSIFFRTAAFYVEHRIDVIPGERVQEVALAAGGLGSGAASTDRGRTLSFDRLALAVGARPRRLTVAGADLDGVSYLRDLDDAVELRSRLAVARRVVVIGGGFIGLEAAAGARSEGRSVTILEAADRLVARSVAPVVSEFYRRVHERRGVRVHLGSAVTALIGDRGRVTAVELADGTRVPADLVLVGIGVVPRAELAEQLGLSCDGGIIVDRCARASNPVVVAAGDCTVLPHPLTGEGLVRLESVQNAVGQAKVAAATLAGRPEPYVAVPWFWSDQYDVKLQIAGLSAGYDDMVVRGDPDSEKFSVLYYRSGDLIAVDAVNSAADYLCGRRALADGATIPPAQARLSGVPLKELLVPGTVDR
jgi:3-phenylpropionate/trans-cinnamate dioxygenase ferredoxin reductase subunit